MLWPNDTCQNKVSGANQNYVTILCAQVLSSSKTGVCLFVVVVVFFKGSKKRK